MVRKPFFIHSKNLLKVYLSLIDNYSKPRFNTNQDKLKCLHGMEIFQLFLLMISRKMEDSCAILSEEFDSE